MYQQILMKLCKEDRLVNIFKSMEGIFDIYCQSKCKVADLGEPRGPEPHLDEKKVETILGNLLLETMAGPHCCDYQNLWIHRWIYRADFLNL